MADFVLYEKLSSQEEIETAIGACSADFFDQSINRPEIIKSLSSKLFEHGQFVSAKYEGQIVGMVAFYNNDKIDFRGFLSMLVVSNQFQGCGIGTALLKLCIKQCTEKGMKFLRLEVNIKNKKALELYKKNGFIEVYIDNCSVFLEKEL